MAMRMKSFGSKLVLVTVAAVSGLGTFVGLTSALGGPTSPSDVIRSDVASSQVIKRDSRGVTWGYVQFDKNGAIIAPDFVAQTELKDGRVVFVARDQLFSGPAMFPDGRPTGQTSTLTLYDIDGKVVGAVDRVLSPENVRAPDTRIPVR